METYKEAVRRIDNNDLDNLEIYELIERNFNLSKLFWFKGDKVKYCEEEYLRIKKMVDASLLQDIIKKAADRYGLGYDKSQNSPTIRFNDGTIKTILKEDFDVLFRLKD